MNNQNSIANHLSPKVKHDLLFLAIAAVIAIILKIAVPVDGGLTEKGASFLGVFVATIFLWISCDTAWPSLLAMIALGVFNIIDATDIFSTVYGNYVCALVIAAMTISAKLEETGAAQYIAKWFLSLKAIKGRPFVFLLSIILATYVISILVSAMLAVLVLTPIIRASMEKLDVRKEENLYKASFLSLFWLSVTAEFMVPFGKVIPAMLMNFVTSNGFEIDVLKYLAITVPINIACIIFAVLTFFFITNPRTEKFSSYDVEAIRKELADHPLSKRAVFSIWMMLLCFAVLLLPSLKFLGGIAAYFRTYETVLAYYIPVIIMCIVPVEGEPLVRIQRDAAKLPWTLILFLGVVMLFTTYTGSADFGITAWITSLMSPLVAGFSPIMLLIFAAVIAAVITNFISNMVTMTMVITVFAPVFSEMYASGESTIHPAVIIMLLGLSSSMAYVMPSSTPTAPIVYGGNLTVKQVLLPNIIFVFFGVCSVLVLGLMTGGLAYS